MGLSTGAGNGKIEKGENGQGWLITLLCAASCQRPAKQSEDQKETQRFAVSGKKLVGKGKSQKGICVCEKILQAINKNVAPRHMPHKIHSAAAAAAAVVTMEESGA